MKINQLKINAYGKLREKQIDFGDHINLIYGKNEAGKSTLLDFITSCFYGISKNKKGKEISSYEKYMPWVGEEFSGKLKYELDNQEKFEVFRDFRKKNPQIFNEQMEDISKEFNIDKNKGNEFFYEQTTVDEALFSSTVLVNQQEVKLGKQEQNVLIQKIANLVGTGDDKVSFQRAIDRIDRRKLNEIGTDRSREKPINIVRKELEQLEQEKQELEQYENQKYEIEDNKNHLEKQIEDLEDKSQFLKGIKIIYENQKIEEEKIHLKAKVQQENEEKIKAIQKKVEEIDHKNKKTIEKEQTLKKEKNKLKRQISILFFVVMVLNIALFIGVPNRLLNMLFLLTIPAVIGFYFYANKNRKKEESKIKETFEKVKLEKQHFEQEMDLLERNKEELNKEISLLQDNFDTKIKEEKEKIKNKYRDKIDERMLEEWLVTENRNQVIQDLENEINHKKIELHTLELDHKNIEPKLENLAKIEEKIVNHNDKMVNLESLEKSMNLAKEVLVNSYEKMKDTVTPKFTEELSKTIAEITNGKYTHVKLNDEIGLVVELENGNYVTASQLSVGTIDQLYLSLRLAMVEEMSEEKMPIFLDEPFAYYDEERLKNSLRYLTTRLKDHQIILYTCTNREKEIFDELQIPYQLIEI